MRRHNRGAPVGASAAARADALPIRDTVSLIREFESTRPARPSPLASSTIRDIPLDLLDRIRSFPLFASAPDSSLTAIGSLLRPQLYAAQEVILTEGDDPKAMYWLARGAVAVTSRDTESVYAELKAGAFFGEIGILMDIPRTASIVARCKTMVLRLNKEDLKKELPKHPEVDRAIREEAAERLAILERKKIGNRGEDPSRRRNSTTGKRTRDQTDAESRLGSLSSADAGEGAAAKKRKQPNSSLFNAAASSALISGTLHIRKLLMQLPLFQYLPDDILHFLGLNTRLHNFQPFTDIIVQGTTGREVFFITEGEVEVFARNNSPAKPIDVECRARLKPGQYFGEVTSLSLALERTATVRTVASVECLVIDGEVFDELWRKCSPSLRKQVEETAKQRLSSNQDADEIMEDPGRSMLAITELALVDAGPTKPPHRHSRSATLHVPNTAPQRSPAFEPADPDPFLNSDRRRLAPSRRGSLANTPTDTSPLAGRESSKKASLSPSKSSSSSNSEPSSVPSSPSLASAREARLRQPSQLGKGPLPDQILLRILKHLDIAGLMCCRQVSMHWSKLLTSSPELFLELDLSTQNRKVTDEALVNFICPFVGQRPRSINISNCYHITDEGFGSLVHCCGANVTTWKMKSVWDIGAQAVVELADTARKLEEVDFSNCRKVSDQLIGRVIGWIPRDANVATGLVQSGVTVVGCPSLSKLTLSYCKHISDRSMAHLAMHAASRLELINLTRCTTITDMGFRHWSEASFPRLRTVVLADCTYLSDNAILYLTRAASGLKQLDLVSIWPDFEKTFD
ncbi:MAG: hypothetical protein M1828_007576 [Chrysothrix sp. TS-e1954]|nr:MAG: hypothetical protein M1828_007576 [Chrysothrix sp. TS-e1954]